MLDADTFVATFCAQGLAVGSRLLRINDANVQDMGEETVRKLVAQRPVTLYFLPPTPLYTQTRARGPARAYTFDSYRPTGLSLHWEEDEGIVRIDNIMANGEAEKMVRDTWPVFTPPPHRAFAFRSPLTVSERMCGFSHVVKRTWVSLMCTGAVNWCRARTSQ